ncbi:MAG: hypothetical protein IE931_04925 [Sphingobacteriales bacterium]|nr:hypothetical protein [Sphingobacteriales bacterium]
MKKAFLSFALCFFLMQAFSQSQTNAEYSIGLKIISLEELPKILNEVKSTSKYYLSPLNGLIFKANDNQISYRFQVYTYKNNNFTFENECKNCEIVTGNYKSLDIKLGFERSIVYSDLQPFYGLDFGFQKINFDGASRNPGNSTLLYNANVEKNGALFYPFIGLKYNFFKALTISVETGIDFYYSDDKEIKSSPNNTLISQNHYRRWEFNTRPIGLLSFEYSFGFN